MIYLLCQKESFLKHLSKLLQVYLAIPIRIQAMQQLLSVLCRHTAGKILPFEILTGKYPIIHTSYFFPHIYYTKTATQFDRLENTFYFTMSITRNKPINYNVCLYNVFNYVQSMLCLPLCLCNVYHYVYVTFVTMSM